MSLKVWLPLNGDLHNQGCSDVRVVNNGATIDNAGKIGSCYSFNGTSAYLQTSNFNPSGWPEFSITFWCYPSTTFNNLFLIRGSNAHRFRIASDGVSFRDTNNSTLRTVGLNATIPIDTQTLLTCIYDRGKISIYINGLIAVNNTSYYRNNSTFLSDLNEIRIARYTTTSTSKYYSGKLNDIRIYNHALSPAEVKEIAQGLVLHYKLDDTSTTIVEDSSGYNNNGVRAGTISAYTNSPRYTQCMNLSAAASRINCGRSGMMTDSITINFWANLPTIPSALSETTGFVSCAENGGFRIQVGNNAHLRSIIYINSAYAAIEGETALQPNTWYMITLIYDRLNSKLYEYLNGEKEAEVTIENTGTIGYNSSNVIWIGAEARSNTNYYNALIEKVSDFRIYCTPLLDTDIKSLYNNSMKIDNLQNIHTFELNENGTNKLTKTGILYDNIVEPYLTLPDGSYWKLMLFHYVNNGTNLFTSSNATYNNGFGLYSRLRDIANYTYNNGYEYYVIQDGKEFRWTQTSSPIAASITGLTTVSGYNNPVNGLAKRSSLTQTYIGYDSWWGACGCWTSYSTGGKTGIPGFGSHDGNGICTNYLALYTRIDKPKIELANENAYAESLIEF